MESTTLVLLEAIRILQIKFRALESVLEDSDPKQYVKYAGRFSDLIDTDTELNEIKRQMREMGV